MELPSRESLQVDRAAVKATVLRELRARSQSRRLAADVSLDDIRAYWPMQGTFEARSLMWLSGRRELTKHAIEHDKQLDEIVPQVMNELVAEGLVERARSRVIEAGAGSKRASSADLVADRKPAMYRAAAWKEAPAPAPPPVPRTETRGRVYGVFPAGRDGWRLIEAVVDVDEHGRLLKTVAHVEHPAEIRGNALYRCAAAVAKLAEIDRSEYAIYEIEEAGK